MNRHYYKCLDCLEPVAIELTENITRESMYFNGATCDCGGRLDYMGKVQSDGVSYVRIEDRCPCDSRCTFAIGPHCDCVCGGKNHGTKRVVQVVIDEGKISLAPRTDLEVRQARVAEYREARTQAYKSMPGHLRIAYNTKNNGQWIAREEWHHYLDAKDWLASYRKACALKTHGGRMKALRKIIEQSQQSIAA